MCFHIEKQRISNALSAHAEPKRLEYHLGRPVKVTGEIKQEIIEATQDNPRSSDFQIVRMVYDKFGVNIGHMTANCIRQIGEFHFLPLHRCQAVASNQIPSHIQFTRDFVRDCLPTENLIFYDVSRFWTGPDNHWVWRRRGDYPARRMKHV
jgi:hypothetical protein